jgi:hypothetical protein
MAGGYFKPLFHFQNMVTVSFTVVIYFFIRIKITTMNKLFYILLLGSCMSAGMGARAQEETTDLPAKTNRANASSWVSDKGYWVVESNRHEPLHACVYFYTNDNTLVYKEIIDGMRLNPRKTDTKMKLKEALETVMTARAAGRTCNDCAQMVAVLFKE